MATEDERVAEALSFIEENKAAILNYNKSVLSKPGLKLFKFTIGPYRHLEKQWGTPWLHLFVVAKSKAEAIRLKKASDKKCDPKLTIRARRHKWFVVPFEIGDVVLA